MVGKQQRRAGCRRRRRVDHHAEWYEIHDDQLGGVRRTGSGIGEYHRDRLAHEPHPVARK
jgi:hypothetical protein